MAFAGVTWSFKSLVTSSKLAQMVENIRAHDHRADGSQGSAVLPRHLRVQAVGDTATANPLPPVDTPFLYIAGSVVVTLNTSGEATVTLPSAFPNGLVTVVVSNGDTAAGGTSMGTRGHTRASFVVRSFTGPTPDGAIARRVNYVAIGW